MSKSNKAKSHWTERKTQKGLAPKSPKSQKHVNGIESDDGFDDIAKMVRAGGRIDIADLEDGEDDENGLESGDWRDELDAVDEMDELY